MLDNEPSEGFKCRAVLKVLQCSSLSATRRTFSSTPNKSAFSTLSSTCDRSSISSASLPAPDRMSARVLKFFSCHTRGHRPRSPAARMMKSCLQFLVEPAKKLKIRLKVRDSASSLIKLSVLKVFSTSSLCFFSRRLVRE